MFIDPEPVKSIIKKLEVLVQHENDWKISNFYTKNEWIKWN